MVQDTLINTRLDPQSKLHRNWKSKVFKTFHKTNVEKVKAEVMLEQKAEHLWKLCL